MSAEPVDKLASSIKERTIARDPKVFLITRAQVSVKKQDMLGVVTNIYSKTKIMKF